MTAEWTGAEHPGPFQQSGDPAADDDGFAAALEREHSASKRVLQGDSTQLKQLCTHADDISLAGRGGGYECGWADVSARFDWVAGQYADGHLEHRLLASGHSGDLGYSFELVSGWVLFLGAEAPVPIALRETHVWRREADGWKLLHRHADQLLTKVEQLAAIDQSWLDSGPQEPRSPPPAPDPTGSESGMTRRPQSVLISGASVAGPMTAYWLCRQGFTVTVVERMPLARVRTSGHAVDLFGPATDVAEWAGVLPAIVDARTRTDVVSFLPRGGRPVDIRLQRLVAGVSARHVEVMRGELASILYEATSSDVEYVFEDSIRTLDQEPDGVSVTFEHGAERRFDIVVGADGLHSVVRRLVFGPEQTYRRFLGGYLAISPLPNYLGLDGRMMVYSAPGRLAGIYPVRQGDTARAGFLFRSDEEYAVDHRDADAQKRILRQVYAGDGWEVPRLLAEMDTSTDFYFDSISQIIMDTWCAGRVALVGDAGYSPGPAVGGGTSIAVVGAYVLAQELARAGGEPGAGFRAYEDRMRELVRRGRTIGPATMDSLIPRTPLRVRLAPQLMRLAALLPAPVQRLASLQGTPAAALDAIQLSRPGG